VGYASFWRPLTAQAVYSQPDLEPLSFDDLSLGGEWTTRRRTISDADVALFAGVAGDFSPLTIEANHGTRAAPPALVVAMAIGLGSMDMPVPSVEEWEWLNWKFPRPIHAGDTIFARWTLTQKRPPLRGATSAIVVWRVDVHTADGALCAEGEVGAKVRRDSAGRPTAHGTSAGVEAPASPAPAGAPRRRRRRRGSNGSTLPEPPAVAAPPAPAAKPERVAGPSRRRRRRRPSGQGAREEHEPRAAHAPESAPAPAAATPAPAPTKSKGGLSNVIRRLRRTGQG
jgi:acyl dehydratase